MLVLVGARHIVHVSRIRVNGFQICRHHQLLSSDVSIVGLTVKFIVRNIALQEKYTQCATQHIFGDKSSLFSFVCLSKLWASTSNGLFSVYVLPYACTSAGGYLCDCVVVPISIHKLLYFVCFCGREGEGEGVASLSSGDKKVKKIVYS